MTTRRTTIAVLVVGLVAAALTLPGRRVGAADEVHPRTASGVWRIAGHGYGHGRGMSQWGSQGAALRGLSYRAILDFYYPGTAERVLRAAPIRVMVPDGGGDTVVGAIPGLGVRDTATGLLYRLSSRPGRWRATADSAGMHLDRWTGSAWARWRAPDGRTTWRGPLRFGIGSSTVLTLHVGGTSRHYRGKLTSVRTGTTSVATVNTLSLEEYLYGVVPAESPPSWRPAALQAQSVAARTYAHRARLGSAARPWDICATTACQVYAGYDREAASTNAAVRATAGRYRSYRNYPALLQYSASNGGWTVDGGVPYLPAKPDPYDAAGGANPHRTWTASLAAADLERAHPQIGSVRRLRILDRDGHGEWGGRIVTLVAEGSRGSVTISGTATRFTLKSRWWTVADR